MGVNTRGAEDPRCSASLNCVERRMSAPGRGCVETPRPVAPSPQTTWITPIAYGKKTKPCFSSLFINYRFATQVSYRLATTAPAALTRTSSRRANGRSLFGRSFATREHYRKDAAGAGNVPDAQAPATRLYVPTRDSETQPKTALFVAAAREWHEH